MNDMTVTIRVKFRRRRLLRGLLHILAWMGVVNPDAAVGAYRRAVKKTIRFQVADGAWRRLTQIA